MIELSGLDRLGEGRLSTVYRLDETKTLKVFKYPNLAEFEFRQSMAVWQAGVSGQQPHSMTSVDGHDAIIYDYLDGRLLMDAINADRMNVLKYIRRMADCHAAILFGVSDGLPSFRDGLQHAIAHAPHLQGKQRSCLLAGLMGMPEGVNVLHGDLHPMNILLCEDGPHAIDWMTGSRGDPAADIARSWFILRHSVMKDDRGLPETIARNLLHSALAATYLSRVCEATDVGKPEVVKWAPFIAAARLTEERPATEVRAILAIVGRYCELA